MDNQTFTFRVVLCTLAGVIVAMVCAMMYGLFDSRVDNHEIFTIIGPAFNVIIGCFVGVISGIYIRKDDAPK